MREYARTDEEMIHALRIVHAALQLILAPIIVDPDLRTPETHQLQSKETRCQQLQP